MRDDYQPRERPAAGGPPHNGFYVDGTVVRDPNNSERGCFITVREGEKSYWDVVCWDSEGPIAAFRALRGGDLVHVEGHLGKRKNKNTGEWEISLIADKMGVVGRAPSAGPPQQPQYQAPPQQPPQPSWGPQAGYQQAALHPDAADWRNQGPGGPPPWGQR